VESVTITAPAPKFRTVALRHADCDRCRVLAEAAESEARFLGVSAITRTDEAWDDRSQRFAELHGATARRTA